MVSRGLYGREQGIATAHTTYYLWSVKVMTEDVVAISDTVVPDRDWVLATYKQNDIRKYVNS